MERRRRLEKKKIEEAKEKRNRKTYKRAKIVVNKQMGKKLCLKIRLEIPYSFETNGHWPTNNKYSNNNDNNQTNR